MRQRLIVSYDLRGPHTTDDDYEELYAELKSLGARRIQESVWAVRTDLSPQALFEKLVPFVDDDDRLLVAHIRGFNNRNGIHLLRHV